MCSKPISTWQRVVPEDTGSLHMVDWEGDTAWCRASHGRWQGYRDLAS
jgi:hypothetical protein